MQLTAAALWCWALITTAALAAEIPALTGRVVDTAGTLSAPARSRIEAALTAHENQTTNQIVVLTVPSTGEEPIEQYAQKVFESWKPGIKGTDNGILLLVAPRDRRLRIHVGYGLEGALPDATANRIINEVIVPRIKAGNFDAAVEEGAKAIVARLEGSPLPETSAAAPDRGPGFFFYAVWSIVLLVIGWYTYLKVTSPKGWIAYVLLAPFWWLVPAALFGPVSAIAPAAVFVFGYPIGKLLIRRTRWYKIVNNRRRKAPAYSGSGGSSGGYSSGGSSGDSGGSSGGYSGGGGDSGGGGASGRW